MQEDESHFDRDASAFSMTTVIYVLLFIVPALSVFALLQLNSDWGIDQRINCFSCYSECEHQ